MIYPCKFLGFSSTKTELELICRRIIQDIEGDHNKNVDAYATTNSPQYCEMVDRIRKQLGITSLKFNPIETLVKSIGLPKEQICTHCFDGSSYE